MSHPCEYCPAGDNVRCGNPANRKVYTKSLVEPVGHPERDTMFWICDGCIPIATLHWTLNHYEATF
jgi:hypothetical protein